MASGVLIIRLRLLGDIIFTIPSLVLYKTTFPNSRIHYVVEEKFSEIGELLPGVDELIVVPGKMGVGAVSRFGRDVRRRGIGTVIDFHSGPKSALLTLATRAAVRVGYRTPNRNLAYNVLVPRFAPGAAAHSVHNQARLLEAIGVPIADIPAYPPLDVSAAGVSEEVAAICRSREPLAVVHTGAGNRFRDWGEDNFRRLVKGLAKGGVRIALIGSGGMEMARADMLAREEGAVDLSGRLSIRELIYLIENASVYFGADSGPLHVASLTATPLVALYGPNIPEVSGPWRKTKVAVLQRNLGCRPCSQRRCLYDTMKCLADISVDEVHEAVFRFIRRS